MATITIQPSGIQFTVKDNETILEAAERNGIDFPYRCRQGVCTSCVCKTIAGDVSYGDRDENTLMTSPDDTQKFTYCCIGYPKTDMTLHHPFIK
ncbi:MAG: 2Fe-2S iron-sulfur cluster binding domain-containing protein [Gammaproteobacteria bacterium]|nr:2Fe-2S iron-sulfur cluster binding domain-containing protein [Gammaproteobacteria bacterium]